MKMAAISQVNQSIGIETSLGPDTLILLGFEGNEEMSGLFHYSLELMSERIDIKAKELIGEKVDIWIKLQNGNKRYFNGYVKSFSCRAEVSHGYRHYTAEIVPWLWFLTKTVDCKIYQNMSALEVIESVLKCDEFANYEINCSNSYEKLDYCVKYLETDYDFISRLLNYNGIYFYFIHEKGNHTLKLHDKVSGYSECVEESVIHTEGSVTVDHISLWQHDYEFFTGNWAQKDFNYETPANDLSTASKTVLDLPIAKKYEYYDYPGRYPKRDEGGKVTDTRMAREELRYESISAKSTYRNFSSGVKFLVSDHDFDDQKGKEYLIAHISHSASEDTGHSGGKGRVMYTNHFQAIPAELVYLGSTDIPKPVINGPQTAIVVGSSGEELFTDEQGRVKVMFHWDRYGKADENSSCWIRVSQAWAGKNWGSFSLPRIGQEVIVSFLNGDPDRPIVTGRVYNKDMPPPYELPENASITGIKSSSSKGGKGFNEFRFEDKKDSEQIFVHAQKNMDTRVRNNSYETVNHNKHLVVGNNKLEHVKNERHVQVDNHHVEKISGDRNLKVDGKEAKSVNGSMSLTVSDDVIEVFKNNHSEKVSNDYYLKSSNIVLEATDNITIKVGQSFIAIESGGITIGSNGSVELDSMSEISITGTEGIAAESPAKIEVKSAQTTVKGDGMLILKGGVVNIN